MRRWLVLVVAAMSMPAGIVAAGASPAPHRSTLHAVERLAAGAALTSPDGRYAASVDGAGRLVVRVVGGPARWRSPAAGAGAYAYVSRSGVLSLRRAGSAKWTTRSSGSGHADVLALGDDGVLALTASGLTVWSTALPYACPNTPAKIVVVDVSKQWARACWHHQQLRASFVTTGASALGDGTPTGTGRVNGNKARNTTLYPAAGGAYPVKYWLPYSGNVYGLHDASWQRIPYGSPRYRTKGSHGCTHVPLPMMRWIYRWATVGARVTIRR